MRIVFMGTPHFAVPSLERLIEAEYRPIAVVTGPDRARGRGRRVQPTPIKTVALRHGLPILQPESVKDPAFARQMADLQPDVIVVVAFKILPPDVYTTARLGAFNLHASLLPAFRGAAPINRALMAGVAETGVTTFFLKARVDTGDMILQRTLAVGPNETAGELHDRLMYLGAEAVLETVQRIEAGTAHGIEQDNRFSSPAPKLYFEDGQIPWHLSARVVHNHIRGLSPYPGAWTNVDGTLLKIYKTRLSTGMGEPAEVLEADERLVVACGDGAVEILDLQRQGRRRQSADTFLRGFRLEVGSQLLDPVDEVAQDDEKS